MKHSYLFTAKNTPDINNSGYFIKGWGYFIDGWFIRYKKYHTTLEEYKVMYPNRTSSHMTKGTFAVFRLFFCK